MANRTDPSAKQIHGMNPQFLLETILRNKIYTCFYWKEKCFALTNETIIDAAVELKYVGGKLLFTRGTYGGNKQPSDFICLILKLLQLQPDKEIVLEYLNNKDYKYLTALAAFYIRLTFKPADVYTNLENIYSDFRKVRVRNPDGSYEVFYFELLDLKNG
jgi:pre-mRNA-splicing factor 38A